MDQKSSPRTAFLLMWHFSPRGVMAPGLPARP